MDTFSTIFGYIVWAGAITFAIGTVWKMVKSFFQD